MMEYIKLREEVLRNIPDNVDIFTIRTRILENTRFATKRRVERIKSIRELVKELESQLLIFPERRGIYFFLLITKLLQQQCPGFISSQTASKVEKLAERLQPPDLPQLGPAASPSPAPSPCIPLPEHIKNILVAALTDRGTGKDWEHFTLGLGYDMEERENIKLRQGDVDRLERNNCDDTREILRQVIEIFEGNCKRNQISINMTDHVIDVLLQEHIFDPPYKRIARKIKEAKGNL